MDNLKFIRSVTWDEALDIWDQSESRMPRWVEHYKSRGFDSWRTWRENSAAPLHPRELSWNIYEIVDPNISIPEFYNAPFRAWINKYHPDKQLVQFKELLQNPEIQSHKIINEVAENFPKETTLIGLINDDKIVITDGTHRCCAVALTALRGQHVRSKIFIILANFAREIPLMGQTESPA